MHMSPVAPGAVRQPGKYVFLTLAFLPALAGLLFHIVPINAAFRVTGRVVRDPQFFSSVLFGTGFFLTLIWYLVFLFTLLILKPAAALFLLFMPLAGYLSLLYPDAMQRQRMRTLKK
jgi:hypothetical protein